MNARQNAALSGGQSLCNKRKAPILFFKEGTEAGKQFVVCRKKGQLIGYGMKKVALHGNTALFFSKKGMDKPENLC